MPEEERPSQPQRYCTNCGAETRRKTRFCVSCGKALGSRAEMTRSEPEPSGSDDIQAGSTSPPEKGEAESVGTLGNNRTQSNNATPNRGILSRIKKLSGENKIMTVSLTVLTVFVTVVGAISDFSGLFGLWSDEAASTARPYMGIQVKNYAPEEVAFACTGTPEECQRLEDEQEIRHKLKATGAVRVVEVVPEGPAAKAGVRIDDLVTGFDGYNVAGAAEFSRIMEEHHPGDTVRLSLYRPDDDEFLQRKSVRMKLEE